MLTACLLAVDDTHNKSNDSTFDTYENYSTTEEVDALLMPLNMQ